MSLDKPHKRPLAWQKSLELVVLLYEVTKGFPQEEIYGLTSQIRRAGVSAPSNISEGAAGRSTEQFKNYLSTAIGSLNEVSTQLESANRVGYLNSQTHDRAQRLLDECLAPTYGLKRKLTDDKQ